MRGRHGEGKVNGTIRSIPMAIIAGALLAQGGAVAHAAPVTAQQIAACDKRGGSLDTRIINCTTVIEGTRSAAVKKRARAHKIDALEDRGVLFVTPGEMLYEGMVIGENAKPQDLEVNPLKSKQLTNFRASGKDEGIRLTPPRRMTLEQAIAYIQDDELVEVTPKAIRIRKRFLDPHERKREARKMEAA